MKRKMLISIALITIMLLNCIMPLFAVNAADELGEEIQLNSKLYTAVKTSLDTQGIKYDCNDITHTLSLSNEVISSIKELNLNEGAISDLTGLDSFTEVTHLELSGNNLSKTSNLSVLNNLPNLTYLDLSTNQLDDVSEISSLISSLQKNGTIVLSGQTVTIVNTEYVDNEEESNNETTATFELPQILELAGYIKSCWKSEKSYSESINPVESTLNTPSIKSIPMYVTEDSNNVEINIASDAGVGYKGMVKVTIYIYDDATEAAQANNPNKASENILNGSRFYLYFIVYDGSSEAITTMDTNLYNAIKEQLTGGQTINPNIASYPYSVDADGNILYGEFTYTVATIGTTSYQILTNVDTDEVTYAYDKDANILYEYDGTTLGSKVDTIIEPVEVKFENDTDGTITTKAGYKIAYKTDSTGITLYEAAYDEAKTFVIDDLVLTNKISSLILNNKQIRDLSGIEYFIGLNSELNVSHNYLSDIEPIYNLEAQKEYWEAQLVEKYNYWLKSRTYGSLSSVTSDANSQKQVIEDNIKAIDDINQNIMNILKDAAKLDRTADKYSESISEKTDSIDELLKKVHGYTTDDGEYVNGYLDNIEEAIYNKEEATGLDYDISDMYSYLSKLYSIYNNEYKLTTLLTDDMNYQTIDEYEAYTEKTKESKDSATALLTAEISYLGKLESSNALSDLDKALFTEAFGIDFTSTKTETSLADYFAKYLEKTALNRIQAVEKLNKIREIAIYSEMANYCLIKRMEEDTPEMYCYEQDYLEQRIKEFGYEYIPTDIEEKILNNIEEGTSYSSLYDVYKTYVNTSYTYTNAAGETDAVETCKGEYKKLDELLTSYIEYDYDDLITEALKDEDADKVDSTIAEEVLAKVSKKIIETVELYESENSYEGDVNELVLYNQLMSLSNKLLNGNVDRYVTLPRLKNLNISYNAELDNLEGLSSLTSLVELNAAYCYIADITNIDWASMTKLRKLNLAYNYISDISALTELTNLRELNLSNNLIAGKLEITEQQYEKLFKNLQNIDLSGNQITDITSLLIYLDYLTGGNYANYLAREDTININLQNQTINMEITDPIYLSDYPTTIDIELPKIFTQLLAIDVARTAFGETCQGGRIESEGTYVTLNTRTTGEKEGVVEVVAMSGDGTEVDTCIGKGTTATIKYVVSDRTVDDISISAEKDSAKPGDTVQYTAVVTGENLNNTKVIWKIEGNTSEDTSISDDGLLTIGEDEEADEITVTAISDFNNSMTVSTVLTIETEPDDLDEPTDPEDPTDPTDPEDPTENDGETIIDRDELGYDYTSDDYLVGISPKTPVSDFKTIFLNGEELTVVVKEEDSEGNKTVVTSGNMKTGMYVELIDEDGNTVKDESGALIVYEVVVKGDINGDGLANSLDSLLIKAHRAEVVQLNGTALSAADINGDGYINVTDSKLLLYHRAEVKGYDLNYSK